MATDPSLWSLYWPVDQQAVDAAVASESTTTTTADAIGRYLGVTTNPRNAKSIEPEKPEFDTFWHLRIEPWTLGMILALLTIQLQFFAGDPMEDEKSVTLVFAYAMISMVLSNTYFTCMGLLASVS